MKNMNEKFRNIAPKSVLLFALLFLALSGCSIGDDKDDSPPNPDIESAVIQFYENIDTGAEYDLSGILDADLADHLADKVDAERLAREQNGFVIDNYSIEAKLLEEKAVSDYTEFKYQVIRVYNYAGNDFDTTVSEEVTVLYDRERELITDYIIRSAITR